MKRYNELTPDEQKQALRQEMNETLRAICEGSLRFDDEKNKDDLQARIDAAINKAESMQTIWFAHEYVMDDTVCKGAIEGIAQATIEDALYPDPNEYIIRLKQEGHNGKSE